MSVMPNLPLRNIDGLTLDRWAKSFQEDITNVVYALASAQGSVTKLEKYVCFIEDRFVKRLVEHFSAGGLFKEMENPAKAVGMNTFNIYTQEGPLEVRRTGAPVAGYASEKPWYFAVKRAFSANFGASSDVLRTHVRDELMLYMEVFSSIIRAEQVLPIYTSVQLSAPQRSQQFNFGQLMPGPLANKDIRVEFHPAEIGNLWFMPMYLNYSQKSVNPAGKLVRREGEW